MLSNKSISDQLRQLALEVVVTLAESSPAVIRKQAKFVTLLSRLPFLVFCHEFISSLQRFNCGRMNGRQSGYVTFV